MHPMVQVSPHGLLPTPQPGIGLAHMCAYVLSKHLSTSSSLEFNGRSLTRLSDAVHQGPLSSVDAFIHPSFLTFFFFSTKSLCVFIYFIEDFIAVAGKLSGLVFKIFL